jgi:hypothetical protein
MPPSNPKQKCGAVGGNPGAASELSFQVTERTFTSYRVVDGEVNKKAVRHQMLEKVTKDALGIYPT